MTEEIIKIDDNNIKITTTFDKILNKSELETMVTNLRTQREQTASEACKEIDQRIVFLNDKLKLFN